MGSIDGKNYRREKTKLNFSKFLHDNNAKLINVAFELYKITGEDNKIPPMSPVLI